MILNDLNGVSALKSYTSLGTLSTSGSSIVNETVYNSLISKLGSKTGTVRTLDGGTPIVFTMAGRAWQVVYRDPNNTDIITVWMCDYYTTATFASSNNDYSSSDIRTTVQNYFTTRASSYPVLNSITVSPCSMSSSYKTAQDTQYTDDYISSLGVLSTVTDKFWLPSYYETFSFWGLDDTDREMSTDYCWLRSGESGDYDVALLISSSGSVSRSSTFFSRGVRPAAHISLNSLASCVEFNVTLSTNNSSYGTTSGGGAIKYNTITTIIATPNAGYLFDYWMIGSTRVESNPYSFAVTGTITCKAYFKTGVLITANTSNSSYGSVSGGGTYESGTLVSLTANPINGSIFAYWQDSGGGTYESNPLTITASSAQTYTAYFIKYFTATITGSQTFTSDFSRDQNYTLTYYLTAPSGYYFSAISVASGETQVFETRTGLLENSGSSASIEYKINENGNMLVLQIDYISADFGIYLTFINTKPVLKNSAGTSIEGVAIQATNGGEARITGSDLSEESDTITCIAVAYAGYQFDGWTDSDGNSFGTSLSMQLTKEQAFGKLIIANFSQISSNVNTETNNTDKLT
ncbi:MAG: hypothetical protein IJ301_05355 [Clostridia bacterium]|nr:hypothetical protein [Clostridia bacterium]